MKNFMKNLWKYEKNFFCNLHLIKTYLNWTWISNTLRKIFLKKILSIQFSTPSKENPQNYYFPTSVNILRPIFCSFHRYLILTFSPPFLSFKDSFFTEKYFGYNRYIGHSLQEADLSLQASNFLSKNYLLIHGTADTLVHQQHTMLLTKSLIQKGVIYRHQVC